MKQKALILKYMTLADLSAWIRVALKWALLASIVVVVLWIGWVVITGISSSIFRPRGADAGFGVMDPPILTKTLNSFKSKSFTNEVDLPNASNKIDVYRFVKNQKTTEEQGDDIALFFGFRKGDQIKKDGLTTWKKRNESTSLKLDTSKAHFTYVRDISRDTTLFKSKSSLDKSSSVKRTQEIFKELGISLDNKDIDTGSPTLIYYNFSASGKKTVSQKSANAVEIKLYRKVRKILGAGDAPIRVLLAEKGRVLEMEFNFSSLDPESAPYPIITSPQAWEEVKIGKAFSMAKQGFDSIKVSHISLIYWESKFYQPYLQPVWMFAGIGKTQTADIEFQAFVPAISSDYLSLDQEEGSLDQPPPVAPN